MPRFSVIIPTYGRPRMLREAINSVRRQEHTDYEIIVVDDAHPVPVDLTDLPEVRLVRSSDNRGPAGAINLGVECAEGEILTFLADDDYWVPQRLLFAEQAISRAPVAICWQSPGSGRRLEGIVHGQVLESTIPSMGATAVRRDIWQPLNESFRACEDLLWWIDISAHNRVATYPEQGLIVRRHDGERAGYGTEARIESSLRLMRERVDYFERYPKAASFRWKRIGLMHLSMGEARAARAALGRSFGLHPTLATAKHLAVASVSVLRAK
jgi:glycosyltransferase involved in cell wall biosynthesis